MLTTAMGNKPFSLQLKENLKCPIQPGVRYHPVLLYNLSHQDEIQSAHWASAQVTIFTAIAYYKVEDMVEHASYTIVSDEMSHDKKSVFAFNKVIINDLRSIPPFDITKVHYWSDGCGGQFKNRYTFVNLLYREEDHDCRATWNFFETAHGKGAVDGIGGTIKRLVWRNVLYKKDTVSTPSEFYDVAKRLSNGIRVLWVSKEDVKVNTCHLGERWGDAKAIAGTHAIHFVEPDIVPGQVIVANNSQFRHASAHRRVFISKLHQEEFTSRSVEITVQTSEEFGIGDFILVSFPVKGKTSPSVHLVQLVAREGDELEVVGLKVCNDAKTVFAVNNQDRSWVDFAQVVRKIDHVPDMDRYERYVFESPLPVS